MSAFAYLICTLHPLFVSFNRRCARVLYKFEIISVRHRVFGDVPGVELTALITWHDTHTGGCITDSRSGRQYVIDTAMTTTTTKRAGRLV